MSWSCLICIASTQCPSIIFLSSFQFLIGTPIPIFPDYMARFSMSLGSFTIISISLSCLIVYSADSLCYYSSSSIFLQYWTSLIMMKIATKSPTMGNIIYRPMNSNTLLISLVSSYGTSSTCSSCSNSLSFRSEIFLYAMIYYIFVLIITK